MNVEEELKEAMRAQVDEVYAPPSMGSAVRRRRRRSLTRFRTAGAVLVTAAVAITVPVVLTNTTPTPGPADAGAPAIAVPGIVVPDVIGMNAKQAYLLLEQAGLTPMIMTPGESTVDGAKADSVRAGENVILTSPAAGAVIEPKGLVQIKVPWVPAPTGSPEPPVDQSSNDNLGDLGDGLTWMGIHVSYLPEGVKWGGSSYVGGFGAKSATVPYVTEGLEEGMYSVQVIVSADAKLLHRDGEQVAPGTWISSYGEGGEKLGFGTGSTLTASRDFPGDLAVQVLFSPDYSKSLGEAKAKEEIAKVIAAIRQEK
ncbi:PASTA domain-containing protein [Herbidospora mongoliensis]|uniref:PASTA domain-containing protein n=1 Tax=Herbidospora mongoliensis TaxID=688067 RepID=UPI0008316C47|nr:PASTA domain-containing protein [Herbidospora mongoliensis]